MVAGVTRTAASTMRWKTSSTLEQLTPATGAPSTNKKLRFCTNGCYYYYLLYLYCTQDKLFALLLTIPVLYTRSIIGTTTYYTCTVHKINYWHYYLLYLYCTQDQLLAPSFLLSLAHTNTSNTGNLSFNRKCDNLVHTTFQPKHKTVHWETARQCILLALHYRTSFFHQRITP